jgi:uncharacterized protein
MNKVYRALLIGDRGERAPYHPVDQITGQLQDLARPGLEIEYMEAYHELQLEDLQAYSLCISYADCWKGTVSDELAAHLRRYVEQGGQLLVIHNGISLQVHEDCYRLIGAKFTGHPPYQKLWFHPADHEHPVISGLPSFEMEEEPYQFEFHPDAGLHILLEYEWDGGRLPAAWTKKLGAGRVVYLMPGHRPAAFEQPAYQVMLRSAFRWMCAN